MAFWGTLYGTGSLWGIGFTQDAICDDADSRVLVQMDDTVGNRKFRDMQCDYVSSVGEFIDVCRDVQDGFDVTTAIGASGACLATLASSSPFSNFKRLAVPCLSSISRVSAPELR